MDVDRFERRWFPAQRPHVSAATEDLQPGMIVVHDRAPYRVLEVAPILAYDLPADGELPHQATRIVLYPDGSTGEDRDTHRHYAVSAYMRWTVLPQHYWQCQECGELPPCRHEIMTEVADRQAAVLAKAMALMPGCCHHCGEPVTQLQAKLEYAGPNLIRPDFGDDTVVFHGRRSCHEAAVAYRRRVDAARRECLSSWHESVAPLAQPGDAVHRDRGRVRVDGGVAGRRRSGVHRVRVGVADRDYRGG